MKGFVSAALSSGQSSAGPPQQPPHARCLMPAAPHHKFPPGSEYVPTPTGQRRVQLVLPSPGLLVQEVRAG
jgi:hypothetical protein